MPKFATQDADKLLSTLDQTSLTIQANFKAWGMPEADARKLCAAIDTTADEIEAASHGPESLAARQAEVVAKVAKMASRAKQGEVIQREPDEPYMDTFKNPMAPIQTESDEPYMRAYGPPDQSSAVVHGDSTTGRPLTSH